MGIPHLTTSLRPYAQRAVINGTRVVIDGPALAYHIYYLCAQHLRTSGLYNQPTYAQLGETAIAWLEQLEECDIVVSAIFFDGHLPQSKQATRFERYCRRSKELNNFFLANATGVRRPSHLKTDSGSVPLFPRQTGHRSADLPPPPFSVSSIIEAIRHSKYSSVTKVVPQEADLYCADNLCNWGDGGIVLTSDSDLLVYDLGREGSVAFFTDVELTTPADSSGPKSITVYKFSPRQMCEEFAITHEYGLSTLAFETSMDPHASFKKLVKKARKVPEIASTPDEFWDFMTQYRLRLRKLPDNCGQAELTRLDTAVSEFVVQCLLSEPAQDNTAGDGSDSESLADERILMFLHQMPDKWSQTTPWEMSTSIRQPAYGTMQLITKRRISSVYEYRRMISVTTMGKHVEIPAQSDLQSACAELLCLLSRIQDGIDDTSLHWIILAMHLDIEWSKKEGKECNTLNVLTKETLPNGTTNITSWNVVHLWALIQGTYFSVRMLGQLLGLASRQEEDLAAAMQELLKAVAGLPSFSEWPDVESLHDLPERIKQKGGLNLLQELSGLTEPIRFRAKDKSAKKQRGKGTQGSSRSRSSGSSAKSMNPFAALME